MLPAELRSDQQQMTLVYGLDTGQWNRLLQNRPVRPGQEHPCSGFEHRNWSNITLLTGLRIAASAAAQRRGGEELFDTAFAAAFVSLSTADLATMPNCDKLLCFGAPASYQNASHEHGEDSNGDRQLFANRPLRQQPYASTLHVAWVMNSIFGGLLLVIAGVVLLNLCLIRAWSHT